METSGPASPVFVDPSGRRHRRVVRGAWLLAAVGATYIGLVVVSLLLPPSVSRLSVPGLGPVLPGPGAAALGAADGEDDGPEVLLARSPSPAPPRSTRSPRPTPSPVATAARPGPPSPATTPSPTATTSPAAPRPTTASTAAPTAPPGQGEPPGQASRSPRPRPTPSKGPR